MNGHPENWTKFILKTSQPHIYAHNMHKSTLTLKIIDFKIENDGGWEIFRRLQDECKVSKL